jgi:AAT family amino acid transporter
VLGTQKGFSHPQQFPMIPTIWLINIWLINWWFMDGWPGWRREFKTNEDFAAEERHLEENATWNPAMIPGLGVGILVGVALYFIIVSLLPVASATFTLVK